MIAHNLTRGNWRFSARFKLLEHVRGHIFDLSWWDTGDASQKATLADRLVHFARRSPVDDQDLGQLVRTTVEVLELTGRA